GTTVLRTLTVDATMAADRWELVGGRVEIAAGTRFADISIKAERNSGTANDVQVDGAMVAVVADGYLPDLGAYGAGTHEAPDSQATKIMLRWPDLYTDWQVNEPQTIRWETANNRGDSAVRIDLLQDTPDGPRLLKTITAATADNGEFVWRPGDDSGIAAGTTGLRIQISLVNRPEVMDRAQESFSVPQTGTSYYVDAVHGSNRNTGMSADSAKANPVNLLRAYELGDGDTLFIAAGDYALIDGIAISGTAGALDQSAPGALAELGRDEGFTITGPGNLDEVARLFPAIAGNRTQVLIELIDADLMTVRNLTLENAKAGLVVRGDSEGFNAANLTASGHAGDGIRIAGTNNDADYAGLRAFDNGGAGIVITGGFRKLTHASSWHNGLQGIDVSGTFTEASDNAAWDNGDWGLRFSNAGSAKIQRNTAHDNRYGLSTAAGAPGGQTLVGDTDLAKANGNRVWANRDGGITANGAVVAGNVVSGSMGNGAWGVTASNALVLNNVVSGSDSGIKASGSVSRIAGNRVYGNTKVGVQTDRAEVAANVIYANGLGLRVLDNGNAANVGVHNNLVWGNSLGGVEIAQVIGIEFVNNTVVQAAGNAVTVLAGSNVHLANNILGSTQAYAISVAAAAQTGFTSDYNLFLAGTAKVGLWQNEARMSLADWRGAGFTDANSLVADAGFVDMDGADDQFGNADDDFHERSLHGGFASGSGLAPVVGQNGLPVVVAAQALTSATQAASIDRGRASDAYGNEPATNGGYVNIGAYGNTAEAGRSPAQFITVLSPNGGERIGQNSTVELRWRSTGFAGTVNIEVRSAGDAAFKRIASGEANDGSYLWNVDAALFPAGNDYEVRVVSVAVPGVSDTSDAKFQVLGQIRTYYVNDGSRTGDEYTTAVGNDANDGLTPDKPKASIQSVLLAYDLNPGDVILVDTGNYTLGTNIFVVAQDSGVTIQGAETHATVLNRANKAAGMAVFQFQGADDVTLKRLQLTGALNGLLIADGADSDGIALVDSIVSGNGLSGTGSGVFVGTGNEGFTVSGSEVRNNTGLRGIYVNAADVKVSGSLIKSNSGVGLELHGARAVVKDNTVGSNANGGIFIDNDALADAGAADVATVSGNTVQGNGGSGGYGISATGNVKLSANTATGQAGSGITVSGGALATANELSGNGIGISVSGTGIAQGNHVAFNATGISASGSYGQVQGNLVEKNTGTGVLLSTNSAGTQVRNNRIVNNGGTGVLLESAGIANGQKPVVENNTVITGADAIVVRNGSNNVRIANNILDVRGSGVAISVDKTSQAGFVSDYNLFALGGNAKLASWEGRTLATRADWAYELGQDLRGLTGTPGYVDEAAGDLHLRADSVAVDRGNPLSVYANEPAPNGGRVDIGAYGNTAEATPSAATTLQLLGPNGLEKLRTGQAASINWRSFGLAAGTVVTVEVSLDGGQHWSAVATGGIDAQGLGQASWTPTQATAGNTALVRIATATGVADQSDEAFLIAAAGSSYYVNDASMSGDVHTRSVGSNANSGLSADSPMASLAALLRAYQLKAGDVVYVDTGNYQLASNIVLDAAESGIE
ncbi:MAG TPA: right-handed parallel beta-helix repeat-containing protein, partial [Roseateles sp.]